MAEITVRLIIEGGIPGGVSQETMAQILTKLTNLEKQGVTIMGEIDDLKTETVKLVTDIDVMLAAAQASSAALHIQLDGAIADKTAAVAAAATATDQDIADKVALQATLTELLALKASAVDLTTQLSAADQKVTDAGIALGATMPPVVPPPPAVVPVDPNAPPSAQV